jgi:ribosome recycling factor
MNHPRPDRSGLGIAEHATLSAEIQKLTDGEIKKMEDMSKAKEKEVLEIK